MEQLRIPDLRTEQLLEPQKRLPPKNPSRDVMLKGLHTLVLATQGLPPNIHLNTGMLLNNLVKPTLKVARSVIVLKSKL